MLLTKDSIKGLSEFSTLKDLHKQVVKQIDNQNKTLASIADVLKKTVESLESSDSDISKRIDRVTTELKKGILIKEMPKSPKEEKRRK
jgi:Fe2+ transport system protein B